MFVTRAASNGIQAAFCSGLQAGVNYKQGLPTGLQPFLQMKSKIVNLKS